MFGCSVHDSLACKVELGVVFLVKNRTVESSLRKTEYAALGLFLEPNGRSLASLGFVTDSETLYSCLFQTKERAVTDRTQNTSNSVKHGADIGRGKVATEAGRSPREEEVQRIGLMAHVLISDAVSQVCFRS